MKWHRKMLLIMPQIKWFLCKPVEFSANLTNWHFHDVNCSRICRIKSTNTSYSIWRRTHTFHSLYLNTCSANVEWTITQAQQQDIGCWQQMWNCFVIALLQLYTEQACLALITKKSSVVLQRPYYFKWIMPINYYKWLVQFGPQFYTSICRSPKLYPIFN